MRFGKISLAAIAAASLVSAPVTAQALSPAAKAVSVSKIKRVGADRKEENKLGKSGVIIAVIAAAAIIGGIIIAASNDDDEPTSGS